MKQAPSSFQARLPPDAKLPARLVVCERTGRWAAALRGVIGRLVGRGEGGTHFAHKLRVYETRSLGECWAMLADSPASILVVELTPAALDPLLERMASMEREYPLARVAIVAERPLAPCEWLLREAGAVYFTTSPRALAPLADLVRRHLDEAPLPCLEMTERIWATLPWK